MVKYAGFEPSSFKVELNDEISNQIIQPGFLKSETYGPLNFSYPIVKDGKATISYQSSHLSKPTNLIAHFAFDLSLWLTTKIDKEPPGGKKSVNFIADIGATYLGFGIFISNATHEVLICSGAERETGQMTIPDRYIFVEEHACSLAIFCLVKNLNPKMINNYCHHELLPYFKKAYLALEKSHEINALKKLIDIKLTTKCSSGRQ